MVHIESLLEHLATLGAQNQKMMKQIEKFHQLEEDHHE